MENGPLWHGSVKLSKEQTVEALIDLGVSAADMEDWLNGRVE
jgi:hypothetical protein